MAAYIHTTGKVRESTTSQGYKYVSYHTNRYINWHQAFQADKADALKLPSKYMSESHRQSAHITRIKNQSAGYTYTYTTGSLRRVQISISFCLQVASIT